MTDGAWVRVSLATTLVVVSAWGVTGNARQSPPPRTVLTIHWSAEDFPGTSVVDAAIHQALKAQTGFALEYHAEHLESDRFSPEIADAALNSYIRQKYRGRTIDVVIANSDPALQFALRHRDELFPGTPIVYYGQAIDVRQRMAVAGVAGVVRTTAYNQTLSLALDLHPSTEQVFVIANAPEPSFLEGVKTELRGFSDRVRLTYVSASSVSGLVETVKTIPARSVILYVRHSQEVLGQVMYPDEVALLVIPAARVPVYITSELYFGTGAIGGFVRGMRATGERLGTIAGQILAGARAQDLAITDLGVIPIFDSRQLRRWNIDPARLPARSDIQFRTPGLWEQYGTYIVAATALMSVQAGMIGYMVLQRSRRRRSEARSVAILRALPDMMFLQNRDGVYLDYHTSDHSQLLMPPERFLNRHMRDVLPPDLARALEESFARLGPGQPPEVVEYTLPLPDGERHYEARLVGANDQVLSIVRDVTDRKRAEASLRESQERYARATAAGGVAVWEWNLQTDETHVDSVLKELLGYGPQEALGDIGNWWALVHPDDLPGAMAKVDQHLRGLGQSYEIEHRLRCRDGSMRWFVTRGSAVRQGGRPIRVIGTITDVTARKRSELALEEAHAELTRVSRLTALGELAGSIGHEMRQPLATIRVITSVCQRWLGEPTPKIAEVWQAMQDIANECERASEVIRRHGDLFRQRTVQKAPLDINSVILEVVGFLNLRLQSAHITFVKSLATALPPVEGDRIELQQLLINLIANSIDAMDNVEPGLRRLKISSTLRDDHTIVVSVSDSGVGLAGVDMSRIFLPSYTTKVNGTGVGLSICRSVVEAHDGRLWAEQNPGVGATFAFSLPLHQAMASTEASALAQREAKPVGKRRQAPRR